MITEPGSQSCPSSHPQMGSGDREAACGDVVVGPDNDASSPLCPSPGSLSRNSSARSSDKSRAGSSRSLNLAVLQESLELSFGDVRKDAEQRRSSNSPMGFNLSERKNKFVRRASDQLAGLLKMHSFREKERKKQNYVRISSSVSELDSMLSSDDHDLDFLGEPRRPPARSSHTPTTPTSPHVALLSSSPVLTEENPDEFVVSRFHHTQIRNRKRKQSPRIQRNVSANLGQGGGGAGKGGTSNYNRSISESPTSSAARSLLRTDDRSVSKCNYAFLEICLTVSTLKCLSCSKIYI